MDNDRAWQRRFLNRCLARAVRHLHLQPDGRRVWGNPWWLRAVGQPVVGPDSAPLWLRVGAERASDVEHPVHGDFWTGIPDSTAVVGVRKPDVISSADWDHPRLGLRVRADLTTRLAGHPVSSTDVLREEINQPEDWWSELRRSVNVIAATPTGRFQQRGSTDRASAMFRVELHVTEWSTAHGDLHWNNLLHPFGLLDWEMWGRAPAGVDAARLLLTALLTPDTAARVRDLFADLLDSESGRVAQLLVAANLLRRAEEEFPDLADPLRCHVAVLLDDNDWRFNSNRGAGTGQLREFRGP